METCFYKYARGHSVTNIKKVKYIYHDMTCIPHQMTFFLIKLPSIAFSTNVWSNAYGAIRIERLQYCVIKAITNL